MYFDVDELKEAAPIIPYVREHCKEINVVASSVNRLDCECPWHKERTHSLRIFSNGTYKCFGCGEQGDVINLVQNLKNLPFAEAAKMIGDNVGFEVVLEPPNPDHEAYKTMMDNHSRRYWKNLQANEEAIEYLTARGLSREIMTEFRLGLTDPQEFKYRSDLGNIANRISFPILEPKPIKPHCIGMGYRSLHGETPKYINDKNQDGGDGKDIKLSGVFVKGKVLYGYSQAYQAIKKTGYVILTEGYMDVISMHQAGLKNTVAGLGTSITETQLDLIGKITKNVLMILDGDEAGLKAATRVVPMALARGLNVTLCTLPNAMDPADLCTKYEFDTTKIKQVIRDYSISAVQYLLDKELKTYEMFVIKERQKVLESMEGLLSSIQNESMKIVYRDMVYKRLDVGR